MKFILLYLLLITFNAQAVDHDNWLKFKGYSSFSYNADIYPKWSSAVKFLQEIQGEINNCNNSSCENKLILNINDKISSLKRTPLKNKIKEINEYVNMYLISQLNKRWVRKLSFIDNNSMQSISAILKYLLLKNLGVNIKDIYITTLYNLVTDESYIVLALKENNKIFILRNDYNTVLAKEDLVNIYAPKNVLNEYNKWLYVAVYK